MNLTKRNLDKTLILPRFFILSKTPNLKLNQHLFNHSDEHTNKFDFILHVLSLKS